MSHSTSRGDVPAFVTKASPSTSRGEALSSPGPPSSHPSTPAKPAARARDVVIAASDDEDDGSDSDNSLEDLSTILGTRRPEPVSQTSNTATNAARETPRAKRTALGLPTSPLTINPKVHKFDIDALAKAARLDDAISASAARAKAAAEDMARQSAAARSRKAAEYDSTDDEDDQALLGVVTDAAGDDAHKVLRAVKRAEQGSTHTRFCFFDTIYVVPSWKPPPRKIRGPWKILTEGDVLEREQNMASGLSQALMSTIGQLPDEMFEWMLDDLCVQESALLRLEYSNLIAQSPLQVERLISADRVDELMFRLGASQELRVRDAALSLTKVADDPYSERDWASLTSFLKLLGSIAASLSLSATIHTAQTLLRMSMDPLLLQYPGLLVEYQGAIAPLLDAIPLTSWNSFCSETCVMLDTLVTASTIRNSIVVCLPVHEARSHELRRRLAIALFLNDTSLSQVHPSEAATLRDIINRLYSADFAITPRTDYAGLQSKILLLDAAIDDGSFSSSTSAYTSVPHLNSDTQDIHTSGRSKDDDAAFDAEIDELADRLREIWRKINDSGLKLARTEAKGVIEWVQQRMSHSVRTRKKLRKSVFDLDGGKGGSGFARRRAEDDPFLPKQQDYMKRFLNKSVAARTENQ